MPPQQSQQLRVWGGEPHHEMRTLPVAPKIICCCFPLCSLPLCIICSVSCWGGVGMIIHDLIDTIQPLWFYGYGVLHLINISACAANCQEASGRRTSEAVCIPTACCSWAQEEVQESSVYSTRAHPPRALFTRCALQRYKQPSAPFVV